jgi:Polyphenol oxidase middle domain
MNTVFTFYDENGGQVKLTGKDVINTISQLKYTNDDTPILTFTPPILERPFLEKWNEITSI